MKKAVIAEEWRDDDGYWIALKAGWKDDMDPVGACHVIVENTKREAYQHKALKCHCQDCAASIG